MMLILVTLQYHFTFPGNLVISIFMQVDVMELGITLNSAEKVMDTIVFHIKRFMLKVRKFY